uniref:G-protein coupled receptors family 1 profile domain-containing protein n=1 Tax=Oryzias latipes TaxID=8090 RepID=A0A3P9HAQ2_ORYLA
MGKSTKTCYSTNIFTVMGTIFAVIFIISILSNALLIVVVLLYENWKNVTTIFIMNLAVADLIFTTTLPFWAVYFLRHWVFGSFLCQGVKALYFISVYSSVLILTALSVDRLILVIKKPKDSFRRKYVLGTCAAAWLIGIIASSTKAITVEKTEWDRIYDCELHPYVDSGYYAEVSLLFLLPFIITVFCYTGIIVTVFKRSVRRKFRSVSMMFCIVTVFFFWQGPYIIALIVGHLYEPTECWKQDRKNVILVVCHGLAFSHCCMNPLLYMLSQKMRKHLYRLCRCEARQTRNPERGGQSTSVVQNVFYLTTNFAVNRTDNESRNVTLQ